VYRVARLSRIALTRTVSDLRQPSYNLLSQYYQQAGAPSFTTAAFGGAPEPT
jgi:hypothetical protein